MMGERVDERKCRIYEVDGEPVRVQGGGGMDETDLAALTEVVRAAKAKLAGEPPGPLTIACPVCEQQPGCFCRNSLGRVTSVHHERREAVQR